jgi:serine/threonine protein kinase
MSDRVLILAEDPDVLEAFALQLSRLGYTSECVQATMAARVSMQHAMPSTLLVDLDGLADSFSTCYQWMMAHSTLRVLPCVFVSGRRSRESTFVKNLQAALPPHHSLHLKPLKRKPFLLSLHRAIGQGKLRLAEQVERDEQASTSWDEPGPLSSVMSAPVVLPSLEQWVGRQIGNATIQKIIGRGGMGAVFLGFQHALDRKVAIKMILPELVNQPSMMVRFQREALAIAQLRSPHIVQVYDAGFTEEGIFFIVMELLEGLDVEACLKQHGSFSLSQSLAIMCQAAKGLKVAHDAGVIHRDIKPSNLILSPGGHTTLTDFGLARQPKGTRFTADGAMLGTPFYVSPEQANGKESDARSDIYSLGIVWYELLVGRVPFPSDNLTEVLYLHAHEPLPDPRSFVASLPEEAVVLMQKMAAKTPEERFQSIDELLVALRALQKLMGEESGGSLSSLSDIPMDVTVMDTELPMSRFGAFEANAMSLTLSRSGVSLPIDPARRDGFFVMDHAGSIQQQEGELSPFWGGIATILMAVVQQLEAVVAQGELQYALCESDEQAMVMGVGHAHIEAMIFGLDALPSTVRMSLPQTASLVTSHAPAPLAQLVATAGVQGLLCMTQEGLLCDTAIAPMAPASVVAEFRPTQLSPVVSLLSSLPLAFAGLDCCFSEGRVLIWRVGGRFLVVWATHQLNKSLLTILLQQQRDVIAALHPLSATGRGTHSFAPAHPVSKTTSTPMFSSSASQDDSLTILESSAEEKDLFVPKHALASLGKEFATFMGPMARLLLKKELKKMGFSSSSLPVGEAVHLVERLGALLDESKREAFMEKGKQVLRPQ